TDEAGLPAAERLASLQETLHPIAEAVGQQLEQLACQPAARDADSAGYLAGLLEAAERLDTVAYAHAVLPLLEAHRPPTLDVASLAFMTYGVAVDGLSYDIPGLHGMIQLARRLPGRSTRCAQTVADALPPRLVARHAAPTDLATPARRAEAAEPRTTAATAQAPTARRTHLPSAPRPPRLPA